MPFHSLSFQVALAGLAAAVPFLSRRTASAVLLLFSQLFYAAYRPEHLPLLWASTWTDWVAARRIAAADVAATRRAWLAVSLLVNLGILTAFKAGAGALPLGISYYTFQTLSYTLDVYRGRGRPAERFLDYALYVTFFPQLLAGPIVRAGEFLGQLASPDPPPPGRRAYGAQRMIWGLFQKVFLADGILLPVFARTVLHPTAAATTGELWLGSLAGAGWIYFDFAGYCSMAIGAAALVGYRLPENFHFPLAARGFAEFWRRWHITLGSWVRDYVFRPLAGSGGAARRAAAVLVSLLLVGLWHAPDRRALGVGLLYALGVLLERPLLGVVPADRRVLRDLAGRLGNLATLAVTALGVGWAGAEFLAGGGGPVLWKMLGATPAGATTVLEDLPRTEALAVLGMTYLTHQVFRDRPPRAVFLAAPWPLRAVVLGVALFLVLSAPEPVGGFLYVGI